MKTSCNCNAFVSIALRFTGGQSEFVIFEVFVSRLRRFLAGFRVRVTSPVFIAILLGCHNPAQAQERPYFVTYSQDMEEPGNLDIESFNVVGNPNGGTLS